MTTPSPRVLELKAAALLYRSPLAALDPEGEPARQRELEAWLARQQISLTDTERALIEGCFDEAQDAALGDDVMPATSFSPPLLWHPLSAEEIPQSADLKTAWQQPLGFLEDLPDRGEDLAGWYRKLWRALMRCPLFRELPAHATLRDHSVAAHRSMTAALVGARFDGGQPAFLALHVGPVQSFIEAARRASDLAVGSYTVGYLAFSGAVALAKELGPDVLLNPDVSCRALADKLLFGEDLQGDARAKLLRAALMNRVLAVVPEAAADDLAKTMATAVSKTWRNMGEAAADAWDKARKDASTASLTDREEFFEQLAQHLEIDQVALPWPKDRGELRTLLDDTEWSAPSWLSSHEREAGSPAAAFGVLADLTERMLAAHRNALQPTGSDGDHRPKCTNCGLREQLGPRSKLPSEQQRDSRKFFERRSEELQEGTSSVPDDGAQRTSLQLTRGEGLCAVCLTKRLATEEYFGDKKKLGLSWGDQSDRVHLRFPSTATFASAPFRFMLASPIQPSAELSAKIKTWLDKLTELHCNDKLNFTPPGNLLEGLGELGRDKSLLAQEGTWFYDLSYVPLSAWRSHFSKDPDPDTRDRFNGLPGPLKTASEPLRELRQISKKSASEYYAVIVLDGDEMGDWKAGRHRSSPLYRELGAFPAGRGDEQRPVHPALYTELSRRLALLNDELHRTVAQHLGRLVYHGGDDVLAFVPLATALPCLDAIRALICSPKYLGSKVTVSAGLSITHWKTPLSYALGEARGAEKSAKAAGKDRFAISLNPRSGEQLALVLPWHYGDAARQQAGTKATIPLLQALLQAERQEAQDEKAGLSSGKAAYVLRDELPALSVGQLKDAFLHRALQLLFDEPDAANRQQVEELFSCLLDVERAAKPPDEDPETKDEPEATDDAKRGMQTVTNLLLFLRFLSRQENGIDPEELLKAVENRMTQQGAS